MTSLCVIPSLPGKASIGGRCGAVAPRIAAAAARHDAKAYYRALRELAWSVPDGHIDLLGDDHGLESQETGGDFGLRLIQLEDGRVAACEVSAGGEAERAGLRYGAELLTWNGSPIERALATTPVLWAEWPPATAAARRADQLRFLVRAPAGASAAVTFRNRGAERPVAAALAASRVGSRRRRAQQEAGKPRHEAREAAAAAAAEAAPPTCEGGSRARFGFGQALGGGAVDWRWLPDGAGYIRIGYELPTLRQVDPAGEVRRAVTSFLGHRAPGIVLDVRGNSGGLDVMVPRAIGCFVAAPRVYEIPAVFDPVARGFLALPAHTVRVLPSPPRFPGRVAVLVDGCTTSSGEGFPLALRGLPGAAVFGFSATAGFFAIGQRAIRLPGDLTFIVPVGRSLGADGRIQVDSDASGRGGVAPDHRLRWTEATLDAVCRDRRDLVLEEALGWLRSASGQAPPPAPGRGALPSQP
jgi:carboxyl-terminal processing protease